MERVIVGLSGGVDSAVAALLLKRQGYDVVGVTLRTWLSPDGEEGRCCEIDDARAAARKIGIPFHAFNCITEFDQKVIRPFIDAYIRGQTPNPCVFCNPEIKWERMQYYGKVLQAGRIATGHYASIVRKENGRYTVRKASHAEKDQTYMLYRLTQEQLSCTLMPLGDHSKQEVRAIAEEAGLPVAVKPDSQEICFVTDGSYADFIDAHAKEKVPGEGCFVDESGKVLGKHLGITHYTVGQRKGLGLALGAPAYVKEIRADRNEVVVGTESSLLSDTVVCTDVNWMSIPGLKAGEELRCRAKIRYHHEAEDAVIALLSGERVAIRFAKPVRAAAPGQSAVFYDGEDCVIGGGVIAGTALPETN